MKRKIAQKNQADNGWGGYHDHLWSGTLLQVLFWCLNVQRIWKLGEGAKKSHKNDLKEGNVPQCKSQNLIDYGVWVSAQREKSSFLGVL